HSSNCVQVVIDQPRSTYFIPVLGLSSIDVKARAVAGTIDSGSCIYALDKTASPALKVDGSVTVSVPSCGVIVNSTGSRAATCGGSGSFTANSIGVAGSASTGCFSPSPTTGTSEVPDPFSYLGTPPGCSGNTKLKITSSGTISQGSYCGGISISG